MTNEYRMRSITSSNLEIDRTHYQRKKEKKKIDAIVSNWNEKVANEPKVSYRDGRYYVFDGQHTVLAREKRNNDKPVDILCKVYKGMDAQEEARLFALQTGISSKVRSGDQLRANLFGCQDEAIDFCTVTESSGIRVDMQGTRFDNHLSCVATALKAYRTYGRDLYLEALNILVEAWKGCSDSLRFEVVKAVTEFVGTYADKYDRKTLVRALKTKKPLAVRNGIITDTKHPWNNRYLYQIVKIYNDNTEGLVPMIGF